MVLVNGSYVKTKSFIIFLYLENKLFILDIIIDAFRIVAGLILMIIAVELVLGKSKAGGLPEKHDGAIAVFPLAVSFSLGPGTIGVLLLMGAKILFFSSSSA